MAISSRPFLSNFISLKREHIKLRCTALDWIEMGNAIWVWYFSIFKVEVIAFEPGGSSRNRTCSVVCRIFWTRVIVEYNRSSNCGHHQHKTQNQIKKENWSIRGWLTPEITQFKLSLRRKCSNELIFIKKFKIMITPIFLFCALCNIAFGHDSWEICDNTVLNWQFGIHCKGTRIDLGPSIFHL